MEADLGEVALGHLEDVAGVGEEYVAAVAVYCHELVLALLEGGEGFGIVAFGSSRLCRARSVPSGIVLRIREAGGTGSLQTGADLRCR